MERKLPTHTVRVSTRWKINGRSYYDNPKRLPYENSGKLIDRQPLNENNAAGQIIKNCERSR